MTSYLASRLFTRLALYTAALDRQTPRPWLGTGRRQPNRYPRSFKKSAITR